MKEQIWDPFRDEDMTLGRKIEGTAFIFVISGIMGWIYEEFFYRINDGYFSWRGHGAGPWLPIYAFGMVILLFATSPVRRSKWKTVLLCALISGGFEYLVGWGLYRFFGGLRLWNYNVEKWNWGNIGGFVCIRSVLVFAVAAPVLIYTLVPLIGRMARKLPSLAFDLITMVPFGLFILDIVSGYLIKGFWH